MDNPPAQNSPTHILNVLNDDCIGEIIRRVNRLEDFLNMAEVCRRFQESAKECFSRKFSAEVNGECSRFTLIGINSIAPVKNDNVHFNRADALLDIFGPMIKSLAFQSTNDTELDRSIFKSITKTCGKTLRELFIRDYDADVEHTKFEVLEVINLSNSMLINFDFESPLKSIKIHRLKLIEQEVWFLRKIPGLCSLRVVSSGNLTDKMVCDFLSLNPNLSSVALIGSLGSNKLSPLIFRDIANYSPNLEELNISHTYLYKLPDIFHENMKYLSSLGNLKKIDIEFNQNVSIEKLINMFAKNDIPIEELNIGLEPMRLEHIRSHTKLMTIKTLKYFGLTTMSGKDISFAKILVNVVKTQTALEIVRLNSNNETLSMSHIKSIVKHGKKLSKLQCIAKTLNADLHGYRRVLFWAKDRVHVTISAKKNHNIPESFLKANREWIRL